MDPNNEKIIDLQNEVDRLRDALQEIETLLCSLNAHKALTVARKAVALKS